MSDGSLTEAALQTALNPLTEPSAGAGGWLADACAVLGLALLVALLIASAIDKIAGRRMLAKKPKPDLAGVFAQLRNQPEDVRRLALFRMLREKDPGVAAKLRPALFDPGQAFDAGLIETLILGSPSHD